MSTEQPDVRGATPAPPGIIPDFENPEDVLHTVNLVSQVLAIALVTPVVGFRLWVRWRIVPPFLIDDCMCLVKVGSGPLNTDLGLIRRQGVVLLLLCVMAGTRSEVPSSC